MNEWIKERVFILVKTYPSPSAKYQEVVCTAGISSSGELIRIYPIKYRYLDESLQFEKYRWIEANLKRNPQDKRPESFKIDYDSIRLFEHLNAKKDYLERRKLIIPHVSESLEYIYQMNKINNVSLGIFKPREIYDLLVEESKITQWTESEFNLLNQTVLCEKDVIPLEKIPFEFSYKFKCENPKCQGHKMRITDWEICQTYRNFKSRYGLSVGIQHLKDKWLGMFYDNLTDFYFIVGTVHRWKDRFIIIGYVNLKKEPPVLQLDLF